jgi:release factor glutamine methyltransferase
LAHPEFVIPKRTEEKFTASLERRKNHEPVALITGHKEFYSREFFVNHYTLIPRPETELLVEKTLNHFTTAEKLREEKIVSDKKFPTLIIDIGTGSGNIIATLVKEIERKSIPEKNFSFIATDTSKEALRVAKKNTKNLDVKKMIRFIQSDLLKSIPKKIFRNAHEILIMANLPYLSRKEYAIAPTDVRNYEPQSALESGNDGLDHYRRLLKELRAFLIEETVKEKQSDTPIAIFFEISPSQKISLQKLVSTLFPKASIVFFQDLAHKWRLAEIHINTKLLESPLSCTPRPQKRIF